MHPVKFIRTFVLALCIMLTGLTLNLPVSAYGQNFSGAFEGMQDSDEPIQIEADRLEVRDNEGVATFIGNVNVVQGTTLLKAKKLKVLYERGSGGPNGDLKYLEATGRIAVRSEDQRITADKGEFNMELQTVRLTGDVIITQGANVVSGCILEVDLETSTADLKPCSGQNRAVMVFDTKNPPKN